MEQKVGIVFNEEINNEVDFMENLHFQIEESTTKNVTVTPRSIRSYSKTLDVFFSFSETIEDKNIFITPKTNSRIIQSKDKKKFFSGYPLSTLLNYFATGVEGAITATGKSATYISNGFTVALMVVSFNSALILIKIF